MQDESAHHNNGLVLALTILSAITLVRLAVLGTTDFNLGPEEAQYWSWSLEPAFGYYSKPPLIAWLIGLSTSVCGNSEWCVRLPAPLLHFATSVVLFFLARDLYGSRIGLWSAVTHATLPGVWYSSALMTADVPLLFFWAVCLLSFYRLLQSETIGWGVALGCAFGLGLLSKYAMLYFLPCMAVYLALHPGAAASLNARTKLIVIALPVFIIAPNIWWNVQNGFLTLVHTAENVNLKDGLINPINLLEFFGAQFGILGPILFAVLLWGGAQVVAAARKGKPRLKQDEFLLSFSLPVLVLVGLLALAFKANANWAAPALVAASVFAVAWLKRQKFNRLFYFSHGVHAVLAIFLLLLALSPGFATFALNDESIDKIRGWDEFANKVDRLAREEPYAMILMDHRPTMAELLYYGRDLNIPVRMWNGDGIIDNHYELTQAFDKTPALPILLVAVQKPPAGILAAFENNAFLTKLVTMIRDDVTRDVLIYKLEGADSN
jgi:hypothetical protein